MICDIEINVNGDKEFASVDSLEVPPCLRSPSFEKRVLGSVAETVTLPNRYQEIIGNTSMIHNHDNGVRNDIESREKDLTTALQWIKQEIIAMKEQDKNLMKQFIDLRSTIKQLRCILEMQSSNSDISSMGGSNMSLDDVLASGSPVIKNSYLAPEYEMTEFRSRTSSLLTPKKTPVTRIKWKSNEFI
ncbi:hypothetical protein FSP39_009003 [Pinctada imbricata]|uniref:Uncharacterized protein n=1 Tax=Pinctada imbricata TaxID=66713 RepID=A0AA88XTD3_PINIB|nr:hypothetical protein FSP39_009003 [Pinctada imbricata]